MSYRSIFILGDDAWPGLGFNPAKGNLEAIADLAADVKSVSTELDQLDELLQGVGKSGGAWEGDAADKFRTKLGKLPHYLQQGTDSMGACAKALRTWHDELSGYQRHAESLENEAVPARNEVKRLIDAYNRDADRDSKLGSMPAEEAKRLNAQLDQQKSQIEQAQHKLNQLVREAEDLYGKWNDRAQAAEAAIRKASETHPPDIGFWSQIGDALKEVAHDVGDWLAKNADVLSTISAGLSAAALACQIVPGIGTGVGVVLGAAAGVTAAGAAVGHAMQGMQGKKMGWAKMGLDVLGVIPGTKAVGALAFGGGKAAAKGAEAGVEGAQAVAKASEPLSRGAAAAQELETGLRNTGTQKAIRYAAKNVALAFGKEPPGGKMFDASSQIVVKGASFGHGIYKQATS